LNIENNFCLMRRREKCRKEIPKYSIPKFGRKDDELEKKMERIRKENREREKKAKLIEFEKRKYGYK